MLPKLDSAEHFVKCKIEIACQSDSGFDAWLSLSRLPIALDVFGYPDVFMDFIFGNAVAA